MDPDGSEKNKISKRETQQINAIQRYLANVSDVLSPIWVRRPVQVNNGSEWFILGCRYSFLFNFRMFLVILYISYRTYRFATLDNGIDKQIENGAIILDVRTEKEFNMGHINGSINISLGTIRERYTELDTSKTYITCCSHGLRSVKAQTILREKGFKNIFNGGAWSDLEKIVKK